MANPELKKSQSMIREERKCRDVLFFLLYVLFWGGLVTIAGMGWKKGNPKVLLYGLDYTGHVCGDDMLTDFKFRYWMNPNEVAEGFAQEGVGALKKAKSICVRSCPHTLTNNWVCDYGSDANTVSLWKQFNGDYFDFLSPEQRQTSLELRGPCYPVVVNTSKQFASCQPYGGIVASKYQTWLGLGGVAIQDPGGILETAVHKFLSQPLLVFERYFNDLRVSWKVILICGLALPLLFGFVWLCVMRVFAGLLTYLTLLLANLLAIAVTLVFFVKAGVIGADELSSISGGRVAEEQMERFDLDASEDNRKVMLGFGVLSACFTALLILVTLFMLKRIRIAVATLRVAAGAVGSMPFTVLFPFIPFVFVIGVSAFFFLSTLFVFSSGDIEQEKSAALGPLVAAGLNPYVTPAVQDTISVYNYDCAINVAYCPLTSAASGVTYTCQCPYEVVFRDVLKYMMIYNFFGWLWNIFFIISVGMTTVAGIFAGYYWQRGERTETGLLQNLWRVLRYHLGSLAIGSLLTAILVFIRAVVRLMKHYMDKAGRTQKWVKYLISCVECCLACLQWVINFVNRNAYIVIAIEGYSYCSAAREALSLIGSNLLRYVAINTVGDFILFLGKLVVTLGSAFIAFMLLDDEKMLADDDENELSSPLFPVVFVLIVAYAIASVFFAVVEIAVDTIFLSFCIDCKLHGDPKNAPPLLHDLVAHADEHNKEQEAEANFREQRAAERSRAAEERKVASSAHPV